ncbi:MAG: hypothetical protein LCI02_22035 [Proteobacteria bacterium]|nr:hypothetical protein [Pseudomonadota bacterium]
MTQTLLDLDTLSADPLDRTGFDIGWDHARHALVPPAELMLDGTPVSQGWRAARAVFGRRTVAASRNVRQWLALRLQAWREGVAFDDLQVTPHYLGQLETRHCPVTRAPLGGALRGPDSPVVARLNAAAGYAAGNLLVLSRRAARALQACSSADQARERAERLARLPAGRAVDACDAALDAALDAEQWARLATLMSLAQPLPQVQAVRLPLRALPPNRVRVLNAAQGLQALLTLRLHAAGWSRRARAIAELLPRPELRHDFNLFVGALAVPLMSIADGLPPRELRWAQEDAWADGRVQRRWAQFAVQLSAAECEAWLRQLVDRGLAGVRVLVHEPEAADAGAGEAPANPQAQRAATAWPARRPAKGQRPAGLPAERPTDGRPPLNSSAIISPSAS